MRQMDDDLLPRALRGQIEREIRALLDFRDGRDVAYRVYTNRSNGAMLRRSHGILDVSAPQDDFAIRLSGLLNASIPHGGRWVVVYAHPDPLTLGPQRLVVMWKDPDGDVPFTVDDDHVYLFGDTTDPGDLVNQCEKAYRYYQEHLRTVDLRPEHTRKVAQGQR